jgi:hypothetical protein
MDIDIELKKIGLKQINFHYNVGDCLFDAITYLLKYTNFSSKMIKKTVCHICKNV